MLNTISEQEASEMVKASPYLMDCLRHGVSVQECERHGRGAIRLSAAYSSIPFYARQAAKDPDYWNKFYASRVNW